MFSLIITIISVALVAALALATLYYGGDAYEAGQAKAEAAKLRNQGQQLVAAAEFYYLQKGEWPETIQKMVEDGFLTTVPVAQRTAIQEALAGKAWVMPVARQPLFTFDEVTAEVCSTLNQDSYGLKGILPKLQPGYMHQCFGPTKNDLLVVVGRGSLPDLVAAVNEGLLVPENVSSDPIPDPSDTAAWTVPPGGESTDAGGSTPTDPSIPDIEPVPDTVLLTPTALVFGEVATNTTERLVLAVTNGFATSVSLSSPGVSGDVGFSVDSTTCSTSLAAGATCTVTVAYSPTAVAADQSATLSLGGDLQVSVTASAYNPVSLRSELLPAAKLNKPYAPFSFEEYLRISNESQPVLDEVDWQVEGTLPAGLSFDAQAATLSGTPSELTPENGTSFTVLATYKNNQGQQVYRIQVRNATLEATQIAMGNAHVCAVTTQGGVKCWGTNSNGALGDGTTVDRHVPVDVVGLGSGVVSVSASWYQTCALTTLGGVKCWGDNQVGQLGNGTTTDSLVPVDVYGLDSGVAQLSVGGSHVCVVTTAGAAKCWGNGGHGRIGDGFQTNRSRPVNVSGMSSGVSKISAGQYHTCAITTAGALKCWGRNSDGELGIGSTTNVFTPANVSGLSTGTTSAVSAGNFSSCAITVGGGLKCWGKINTTNVPANVSGLSSGVSAVTLSPGGGHVCALTADGQVKCFGANQQGQVGSGTTGTSSGLKTVAGLLPSATGVAAGAQSTCALLSTGGVKCWGDNLYGQLGNGSTIDSLSPVDVLE